MAVTYLTGPMGRHRGMIYEGKRAKAKLPLANSNPAGNAYDASKREPRMMARIDHSTKEVTARLRKLSIVVVSSAAESTIAGKKDNNGSTQGGTDSGMKRTTSLSEATQSPTRYSRKGPKIFGFGKKDKVNEDMEQRERVRAKRRNEEKEKPVLPFVMGEREAYATTNIDPLYPVTENGWLRDAYVNMLVERVNEENNRGHGWDGRCIGKWFGQHLQTQIRHGKVPRNKQAHFLAAVELHRRMSTDPRVPHPNGVTVNADDLWRDVADALDPAMKYSKAVIMHNAGTLECTLEDFIQDFHRVVVRNSWNTEITTAMFPARPVGQYNGGRSGSD